MKICVIGYSGSGKSTLSNKLGEIFKISVLHIDSVQFKENWVERGADISKALVREFLDKNENWVIDGSYSNYHQEERLENADLIIFMDFSATNCLVRVYKRYFKYRGKTRPDMALGCNEKIDLEFVRWVLFDGRTKGKKQNYNIICEKYKDKTVVLKNQRQLDRFIKEKKDEIHGTK